MASSRAVWGIDIGQCALKALRCTVSDDPTKVTAEAFDFIEYPKILSQPEADPVELVREALELFLSRNSVKGDRVAISVPGQAGLARFIKLPPVESKKIPDIVKYEAKQQIPFPLDEVVWDFQRMAGGMEEEGFALETEVGLFAMKREQVTKALRPFNDAGIEIDIVQLAPLALYNFVVFDQMQDLPAADLYDADNPPDSVVVLSMGTDTTDLVVTNGFRVWQRSVPVGGNHFTKAMTKELKLTFAKAEHLKRNASHADDAKAVFQAMRPVFSDLVTETQRSIGYFTNIDRKAKISRIVALGNAMKLPGLQRFVAQNIGLEVDRVESFRGLDGAAVLDAPTFKENTPAFGVCYGLALQGLRDVRIKTNLVPPEIIKERMIRAKKPWAVAAAALLMLGLTASFGGGYRAWSSVHQDRFGQAMQASDAVNSEANGYVTSFNTAKDTFKKTVQVGENLVYNVEGRLLWVEVMKAINLSLPRDDEDVEEAKDKEVLYIENIECQKFDELKNWWATEKQWYRNPNPAAAGAGPPPPPTPPPPPPASTPPTQAAATPPAGGAGGEPAGPGWVFELNGYHYHNSLDRREDNGNEFLMRTLIKNLHEQSIDGFPVAALGISHAMSVNPPEIRWDYEVEDKDAANAGDAAADDGGGAVGGGAVGGAPPGGAGGAGGFGAAGGRQGVADKKMKVQPRFNFKVQFCWRETPPGKRPDVSPTVPAAAGEVAADAAAGVAPEAPAIVDAPVADAAAPAAPADATVPDATVPDATVPDATVPDADAPADAAAADM
jgi:type IV pilus assembly protein PilM